MNYVYDGAEVILTGREAFRDIKNTKGIVIKQARLIEIKPADESFEWRKWVDPSALFEIRG
jgi:hypothetical protein